MRYSGLPATALLALLAGVSPAATHILPTPHYFEPLNRRIPGPFRIVAEQPHPKLRLAAEMIGRELPSGDAATIHLWDYASNPQPPVSINLLDREVLGNQRHWGQSYVLLSSGTNTVWVIGASPQGVLWGAASLIQLIKDGALEAAYIRDYPDFELRAASDWLLNIEINGWALDRGQGVDAFARTVEAKLDRALRFKINMALMDGFGFSIAKRPPFYPALMRRLNGYARARGIHLYFGGYGASYGMAYEPVVMYENGAAFKGTVFENRKSYPDGPLYRCMGFPKARRGYDPSTLGSCRSNEALNGLKAAEISEFVRSVEPGALYIHHEDFGGFDGAAKAWLERCDECRRRWPNDSLAASDGGAGGLANGYSAFVRAINEVRNPTTGYDAARDCQIILVSPVYVPSRPDSASWANALELWSNIGRRLPAATNVEVCFREVWPLQSGGERWTERLAAAMRSAGLTLNTFLFYAGGADRFVSDYPLSGAPAMNALFEGARGIYNATGDFYQEPMELIAAEYSWNVRSDGFFCVPATYDEARVLLRKYAFEENEPKEIFGSGKLYERSCELLYGKNAGKIMADYYRLSTWLPEAPASDERAQQYLPLTWDRMYAAPSHWRHLVQDSHTWGRQITDETFAAAVTRMQLSRGELHRRLARRWSLLSGLNRKASASIASALAADPLPASRDDLTFLGALLSVYQPFIDALAEYHGGLHAKFTFGKSAPQFDRAAALARQANRAAADRFPQPIDPVGGEIGGLRGFSAKLVQAVDAMKAER